MSSFNIDVKLLCNNKLCHSVDFVLCFIHLYQLSFCLSYMQFRTFLNVFSNEYNPSTYFTVLIAHG